MEVAAADTDGGDFEEHVLVADGGLFLFTEFYRARLRGEINNGGGHGSSVGTLQNEYRERVQLFEPFGRSTLRLRISMCVTSP